MKQPLTTLTIIKVIRANSRIGLLEAKHAAEALNDQFNVVQAVNSHDVLVSALKEACMSLTPGTATHIVASNALKTAGVK